MQVLLAALTALVLLSATAKGNIVEEVLGCKSDPCIVTNNPGGTIVKFELAAEAIRNGDRTLVVIDGPCKSACTILIDRIPEKVCLTVWARLYFHQGTRSTLTWVTVPGSNFEIRLQLMLVGEVKRFTPDYSPAVARWIDSIGGLPKDGSFVVMPTEIAQTIWPRCKPPAVPAFFHAHGLY